MKLKTGMCRFLWHQRWINQRWKKTIYRYLDRQGEPPDAPFATDFFGLRYEGNLNDGIEFAIFYYGAYEKPILFFLRDAAHSMADDKGGPPECFCDIGSNVGQHTLFMSQYVKNVHAFEPYKPVRQQLEKHLTLNGIHNVTVHGIGLGENNELKTFYEPIGSNQGIGSFSKDSLDRGTRNSGRMKIVNGDSYLSFAGINRVNLIKIDVEGFEKPALHGLRDTLQIQRPLLVCEITYSDQLSFQSLPEFKAALPANYDFFLFNKRNATGGIDKRRGSQAKRTGAYQLVPLDRWRKEGQDDIVAIPNELLDKLPLTNSD
ncbi:MAG: FkbM family methyltransferase [Gammaproteobacteria bacterium]|nr:FkbM family methyltransferase [Gammaproteobacteria bacterium]MCY4357706.1 FkbM family methyltransferase [Gammaproteobacteria bacterium]